jgi:hypothetical protein
MYNVTRGLVNSTVSYVSNDDSYRHMNKLQNIHKVCLFMNALCLLIIIILMFRESHHGRYGDAGEFLWVTLAVILSFFSTLFMYVNVMIKAQKTNVLILLFSLSIPMLLFLVKYLKE